MDKLPTLPKGKCLETRNRNGMKWRRYRTPDGVVYTTYELPTEVLNGIVPVSRFVPRMQQWYRGYARKKTRSLVEKLLLEGWKAEAVAHHVGFTPGAVSRIKRTLKQRGRALSTSRMKYGNT